jgi:hypothetical protein
MEARPAFFFFSFPCKSAMKWTTIFYGPNIGGVLHRSVLDGVSSGTS